MGRLVEGIGSRTRPADEMGCRGRPVDVISCRGARPTTRIAGGIRPKRWLVGAIRRTPENKHQDPEVVREKVKSSSMPAGCAKIHNGIER